MESNLIEIVLFSDANKRRKMIVEWITKMVLPIIVKQEDGAKKFILKPLTDTPAIYMS